MYVNEKWYLLIPTKLQPTGLKDSDFEEGKKQAA
jgi:hypothetical protein